MMDLWVAMVGNSCAIVPKPCLASSRFASLPPCPTTRQAMDLNILFEDEHMVVINKPPGLVVHPAPGNWHGTLVNGLVHHFGESFASSAGAGEPLQMAGGAKGGPAGVRPGIVHRLDKGTSGVMVVAKTGAAHAKLSDAFKARHVKKTYLAICVGQPADPTTAATSTAAASEAVAADPAAAGRVPERALDEPIGRHPVHRHKMAVHPRGRSALTFVNTVAYDGRLALARVRIETGRTHQIRVHLAHCNHPILGDETYGHKDWNARALKSRFVRQWGWVCAFVYNCSTVQLRCR